MTRAASWSKLKAWALAAMRRPHGGRVRERSGPRRARAPLAPHRGHAAPDHMLLEDWGARYPNLWIISTVVNQAEADRPCRGYCASRPQCTASALNRCSNLSSYGSTSPNLADLSRSSIICGSESGAGCRPMHMDWARSLLAQCRARGVPFFFSKRADFLIRAKARRLICGCVGFPADFRASAHFCNKSTVSLSQSCSAQSEYPHTCVESCFIFLHAIASTTDARLDRSAWHRGRQADSGRGDAGFDDDRYRHRR